MEASPGPIASGQVCDRCRLKKIKCDATLPTCRNCVSAGASCTVSAKLRRKTKIRGFQSDTDALVQRLQADNAALTKRLQHEEEKNRTLQHRVEELSQASNVPIHPPETQTSDLVVEEPSLSGYGKNALVIKHMGRLLYDDEGIERFGGSTTGVHFILSVQQSLNNRGIFKEKFPENCFRIHLLQNVHRQRLYRINTSSQNEDSAILESLRAILHHPFAFYAQQVDQFLERWSWMCPVIARSDLNIGISTGMSDLQQGISTDASSLAPCFHLVMILLINHMNTGSSIMTDRDRRCCLNVIDVMLPQLAASADISCIQGLILLSLYIQISGQALVMPNINGLLVQAAQLSGLHRHSRRFKFSAGQVEMRKRMWWCIYLFDKMTSFTLGLPQLIHDEDVDVDYPVDCELESVDIERLSLPLPGETTPMSDFISLAHVSRILASTLEQLYTTTRRRHGGEKILRLHSDLQSWNQRFNVIGTRYEVTGYIGTAQVWLSFIYHFAIFMIHRPGLTFDEGTPQFRHSLECCQNSSSEIVRLASSHFGRGSILGVAPLGASLLFQCGLVHIYYNVHAGHGDGAQFSRDTDSNTIEVIQNLLLNYRPSYCIAEESQGSSEGGTWGIAMVEATQLLQSLSESISALTAVNSDIGSLAGLTNDHPRADLPTPALSLGPFEAQQSSPPEFPSLGFLENLNQVDYLDWVFEEPLNSIPGPGPNPNTG